MSYYVFALDKVITDYSLRNIRRHCHPLHSLPLATLTFIVTAEEVHNGLNVLLFHMLCDVFSAVHPV